MEQLERELRKLIEEQIKRIGDVMLAGQLPDHSAYRHQAGVIVGFQIALSLIDEARKNVNNR